jgi:hypothetical protein
MCRKAFGDSAGCTCAPSRGNGYGCCRHSESSHTHRCIRECNTAGRNCPAVENKSCTCSCTKGYFLTDNRIRGGCTRTCSAVGNGNSVLSAGSAAVRANARDYKGSDCHIRVCAACVPYAPQSLRSNVCLNFRSSRGMGQRSRGSFCTDFRTALCTQTHISSACSEGSLKLKPVGVSCANTNVFQAYAQSLRSSRAPDDGNRLVRCCSADGNGEIPFRVACSLEERLNRSRTVACNTRKVRVKLHIVHNACR